MNEVIQTALAAAGNSLELDAGVGRMQVRNEAWLRSHGIDALVYLAVFSSASRQAAARWLIWETAQSLGIYPASIHELTMGRGHDPALHAFTTPVMSLHALSYDVARSVFSSAIKGRVGAFMFELSCGGMPVSAQQFGEYSSTILAAAIKEGYRGPVFLQGAHCRARACNDSAGAGAELTRLRNLIDEALSAGFYNFEFDASAPADANGSEPAEQRRQRYEWCAALCDYVRTRQPAEVNASLGIEIGALGGQNGSIIELRTCMDSILRHLQHPPGLTKVAVRAGTDMSDAGFERLKELSTAARHEYGMGGVALHGDCTLPQADFHKCVEAGCIELHLAAAFQNLLFDHLPAQLVTEINAWLCKQVAGRRKPGEGDQQFVYRTRSLAAGPFKKQLWNLSDIERAEIRRAFAEHFALLFESLGVRDTADMARNAVQTHTIHKRLHDFDTK